MGGEERRGFRGERRGMGGGERREIEKRREERQGEE